ncbi:MAG: hypothetical protein DSZ07_02335 [Sulfurovum sp.]|nr:MAG: hypothetical protein DSZ07_02335 [Sulfurovum sp.]
MKQLIIGSDVDSNKIKLALEMGADEACHVSELIKKSDEFSNGYGVDTVEISRMRGCVVFLRMVGMEMKAFQESVKNGNPAISFESIYNTT